MAVDTPALDDYWRLRVEEAKRRHLDNPTAESGAEYRRLLRIFADLVLRDQLPPEARAGRAGRAARVAAIRAGKL